VAAKTISARPRALRAPRVGRQTLNRRHGATATSRPAGLNLLARNCSTTRCYRRLFTLEYFNVYSYRGGYSRYSSDTPPCRSQIGARRGSMNTTMLGVFVLAAAGIGCGSQSPLAPEDVSPTAGGARVTVSGQVYVNATGAEPPIANASITVKRDGSASIATTDANGFYSFSVASGNVSIAASKEGYESKSWQLVLRDDTVLNFSLTPK
jgi:Carboxypeptidase regulatory-like domain